MGSLYADSEMKKILNEGHEISVPDPVYAKVEIQEVDFNVQLKKCWATPTPNPADKTSFVFIDDFKPSAGSMEVRRIATRDRLQPFGLSHLSSATCQPKPTIRFICTVIYISAMAKRAKIVHVEMETSASAVHSWKKHHMLHLKSARSTLLSDCTMISSLHDYLNNLITYYATSLLL